MTPTAACEREKRRGHDVCGAALFILQARAALSFSAHLGRVGRLLVPGAGKAEIRDAQLAVPRDE